MPVPSRHPLSIGLDRTRPQAIGLDSDGPAKSLQLCGRLALLLLPLRARVLTQGYQRHRPALGQVGARDVTWLSEARL